jgi:hypothetical protein
MGVLIAVVACIVILLEGGLSISVVMIRLQPAKCYRLFSGWKCSDPGARHGWLEDAVTDSITY